MIPLWRVNQCKQTTKEKTVKKILTIGFLISSITLGGCATQYKEKKAPCGNGKTASLSSNPCDPLPINVADFEIKSEKIS